jgi:hypothetical protein
LVCKVYPLTMWTRPSGAGRRVPMSESLPLDPVSVKRST